MYSSRLDCNAVIVLFLNDMTFLIHDLSTPLDCDDGVERLWDRVCTVAVFFWFIARNLMVCQKHSALSCLKYEFWCWSIFQAWWFLARLWERWAFAISHLSYETNAIRHFVLQVHFFWLSGGSQDPSTDLTAWTRVRVWGTGCWPCGITFLRVSACHQADSTLRECVIFDPS